jgi:tetratricopeptide (TPR) repeat protein
MSCHRLFFASTILTVALASSDAHADKQAEALFAQGKKAMAQKAFESACKAFEDSQRIEPLIGTQMNIGLCYEQWGKMASAHRAFRKAQRMAQAANDTRALKIGERAASLEPSLSLLQVRIPDNVNKSDVTVSVDDKGLTADLLTTDIAFEPGEHTLSYQVGSQPAVQVALSFRPGKRYQESISQTSKGKDNSNHSSDGKSEPTASGRKDRTKKTSTQGQPAGDIEDDGDNDTGSEVRTGSTQRIVGLSLVGAGSVAMGVSGYLAYAAKKDYKNALRNNCAGNTMMCDDIGLATTKKARKDANLATVVFSAGLGTALAGGIVYMISPTAHAKMEQSAMFVSPQIDSSGATIMVGGQF